jgi:predicted Rossmann-fold nucleotide-binding protein
LIRFRTTAFPVTDTMHERKAKFFEDVYGIAALPGGTGTLEELLEAITLKRIGQLNHPTPRYGTRKNDIQRIERTAWRASSDHRAHDRAHRSGRPC